MQVHAVPMQSTRHVEKQQEEGLRMWKEQLKWVLLWLTLSLLTCMHSAALILALQYNLIAMVSTAGEASTAQPAICYVAGD